MTIGLFGGVFNPVHNGHLALVDFAVAELKLTKLLVIPCADPPHKPKPEVDAAARLEMVKAAFEGHPSVVVSDMEIQRSGPSYTIDTIRIIKQAYAVNRPIFLIGADNLQVMHTWKEAHAILEEAQVVALTRPGFSLEANNPNIDMSKIIKLEMAPHSASSSLIREKIAKGLPVDEWLPEQVVAILKQKRHYQFTLPVKDLGKPFIPLENKEALFSLLGKKLS